MALFVFFFVFPVQKQQGATEHTVRLLDDLLTGRRERTAAA
jgi:hypothetical protein